jgi:1-acyl-sn-glycerol-3-phosphate acyltransferase
MVANHISWLDILVIHAARHCRFVSKSDIRDWPLVGMLATGAGTLYIERTSRKDALRMVKDMADAMRNGDVVAVFPEGTTSDGRELLPFHANLIQAAIQADAPVQPMSLKFTDAQTGAISFAPCYIGDDTLIGSMWRTLKSSRIEAVVHFGEPQAANGRDRRVWARDLREEVIRLRDVA